MNKNHVEYIVLFGNDRNHPDDHYAACRNKFDYIADARKYAKGYSNASIFEFHFAKDSGDILYCCEKKR